ncbi:hypothetical protein Tco_0068768, partial [Tanacetum coccineum]
MFDEYIEPPRVERPVSPALAVSVPVNSAAESTLLEDNPFAPVDNPPFINVFAMEPSSEASSSGNLIQQNLLMSLKHFIISRNGANITYWIILLAIPLGRLLVPKNKA